MRFILKCFLFSFMIFSSGAYDSSDYSSDSDNDFPDDRREKYAQQAADGLDDSFEDVGGFGSGGARARNKEAPCCFPYLDKCLLKVCCPCGPRNDFSTSFPATPSNGSAALHATIGLPCLPVVALFSLAYAGARAVAVACCGAESVSAVEGAEEEEAEVESSAQVEYASSSYAAAAAL